MLAVVVGVGRGDVARVRAAAGPRGLLGQLDGHRVELTTEQAENATLIAAIGVSRGLPARAVSIALATAYQESKIRNLNHGDRDSLGLFQQRPSQGWGTAKQVRDPYYAINKFYDALEKIPDYKSMRITEAAQQVQRSGFPEAYEDHAADARALASVLTGYSPGGLFTCVVHEPTERGSARPGDPAARAGVRRPRHRAHRFAPGRRRHRCPTARRAVGSAGRSHSSSSPTGSGCTPRRSPTPASSGAPAATPRTAGAPAARPTTRRAHLDGLSVADRC